MTNPNPKTTRDEEIARDEERRGEERREAKIEAKIEAEAPPVRPMGVEDPDDEPDGAVVTEPDFDGAGAAHYGQAEWDRIERERLGIDLQDVILDAYVLGLDWTTRDGGKAKPPAEYGPRVDSLFERDLIDHDDEGRCWVTDSGRRYYESLPEVFVVDRTSPALYHYELVAKGQQTYWVTIAQDRVDGDDSYEARVNWRTFGTVDPPTARTFAEMVGTAAGIAERLNRGKEVGS